MLRVRAPLGILLAATLVMACGGGTTPAATAEANGDGGTTATQAPDSGGTTATPAPVASADAGGGVDLGAAAASLDNLDNYSFKMVMAAEGGSKGMMGMTSGGSITMEGAVQLKPVEAADMSMTLGDGSTTTEIKYRIIGDKAYMDMGGGSWISVPAEDAASTIDSLKPGKLLQGYATSDMPMVGEEEKNGIPTIHYQSTADPGIGSMLGLPTATWTIDTWLAKDGGFPVAGMIVAEGKNDAGEAGTFSVSLDVTSFNDPNLKIETPDNVQEMPG